MTALPQATLTHALQWLDPAAAKQVANVSRAWRAAAASEGYWASQAEVRGVGPVRPLGGVSYKALTEGFDLVAPGRPEWLVWWDAAAGKWSLNDELLALWNPPVVDGGASRQAHGVASVAVCPCSAHPETVATAAGVLLGFMRARGAADLFAAPAPAGRVGVQVWANPALMADGARGLFLFPHGMAPGEADAETAADAAGTQTMHAVRETLRAVVLCLASAVYVVDTVVDHVGLAPPGRRWWAALFPEANPLTPHERAQRLLEGDAVVGADDAAPAMLRRVRAAHAAGLVAARHPTLTLLSCKDDASLPTADDIAGGDARLRVAGWLAHYEEVACVHYDPADVHAVGALAADCFNAGAAEAYGAAVRRCQPGAVWPQLGAAAVTLPQWAALLRLVVQTENASIEDALPQAARAAALYGAEFGKAANAEVLALEVGAVVDFYVKAMMIEMDDGSAKAAERAERGEAAEAPPVCAAPLPATDLIELHEQHYFAAYRRLCFALDNAGLAVEDAVLHIEQMKNKVSDAFRDVWVINQRRSKHFCAAVFDHVMLPLVNHYAPDPSSTDDDAVSSDTDAEDGDVVGPSAALPSASPFFAATPPQADPAGAAKAQAWGTGLMGYLRREGVEDADRDVRLDTKYLKRFYASFVDRLDEYEMKAVGGRAGDVLLDKAKDLLERVEASKYHGFKRSDIELVTQELSSVVTQRVMRFSREMEKSRQGKQKTQALYTKMLGLQARMQLAGALRRTWDASRRWYPQQHDLRLRVYAAAAGVPPAALEEAAADPLLDAAAHVDATIARLAGDEADAAAALEAFSSSLPNAEAARFARFGIVKADAAAKRGGVPSMARLKAGLQPTKAAGKALFSKMAAKVGKLGGKF
eukprot:TRINITY_DN8346_c0_g2_i1.p1 TRINITY_DN8346_c0_g2~~TRINITY_DN8346_c0_g2_i1.p1  ORF type:complete len:873 (+),score=346.02 TRINITY_DN8346_c0_g2_i1:61-2679(+)